jgi:hypothetical protein
MEVARRSHDIHLKDNADESDDLNIARMHTSSPPL